MIYRLATRLAVLSGCVALGLVVSSCSSPTSTVTPLDEPTVPVVVSSPAARLPVTVTDASGRTVTVTDTSRIVSLNGGISEVLVSLGLRSNLVGRDVSADFPEVADVPLVTSGHDASAEGVLSIRPTLVLGDARSGPPEALQAIRSAGVPVVIVPEVWELSESAVRVDAIAAAVGLRNIASDVNNLIAAGLPSPTDWSHRPKVAFLYLRGTAAVYLLGGQGSGADEIIEAAGGIDAGSAAGLDQFTPLTPESLASTAPDVLLVMSKGLESVGGVDGLVGMPGVAQTPAGQHRRVIAIPDGQLLNFGPRTPQTVNRVATELRAAWQQ